MSNLIAFLIMFVKPDQDVKSWQVLLLFWALVMFSLVINTVTSRALAKFEGAILILHLFGFFAVLIPLVYFGQHGDTSIFTTFLNEGDWQTQALSFFVGLPSFGFALMGSLLECILFKRKTANFFVWIGSDSAVHACFSKYFSYYGLTDD